MEFVLQITQGFIGPIGNAVSLKLDLLRNGYLPENLPPTFHTDSVSEFFAKKSSSGYFTDSTDPVRAAIYNASKRGLTRRTFSVLHPATAHDLAHFIDLHESDLTKHFAKSTFSLSTPRHTPDGVRAVDIASHGELEAARLQRLSGYRFIAKTDISRFYHSIYTHAVPWAVHGKALAKDDRRANSTTVVFNKLDQVLRHGQDQQTIGIPVGPDASRYIAEILAVAIDAAFQAKSEGLGIAVIRHVDDIWIGAQTHADAENALWRYRESLREFELDINESKTRIYAEDFSYADAWPVDVSTRLEQALSSQRKGEKLRAALEYAFVQSIATNDDGVLKYVIRQLDRSHSVGTWSIVQPFLMRCVVHFGHTVDYVVRVLVWRKRLYDDLDEPRWAALLASVLDRQARLGNDSEVSWLLFAALRLDQTIPEDVGRSILLNCGALSAVGLLHAVIGGLASPSLLEVASDRLKQDSYNGPLWPLALEWLTNSWSLFGGDVGDVLKDELVRELAASQVSIFNKDRFTTVFDEDEKPRSAIERRVSFYDADEPEPEDETIDPEIDF